MTTCNAMGNGYAAGGTACAPMHCSSGACRQPLFIENFEDGDAVGWTPLQGTISGSAVVNTTAAAGTTYSFREGAVDLYRSIPAAQPTAISFWANPTDTESAAIQFGGIAQINFGAQVAFGPGSITLNGQKSLFSVPYQVNTWTHVELRNIDWTALTFDVFVNDALVVANVPAGLAPTTAIYIQATAAFYWDEIALYQTSTCTPNRPVCNGDVAQTCNTDGSGYVAGGMTCNPNSCYIGKCVTAFLSDNFEDGDTAGWIPNPGTWTANVVTSTAAAGTAHSLELTGGTYFNGPYYGFHAVKPKHIGFWMMGVGGEFVVSSGTTADNNLIRISGYSTYPLDGNSYGIVTSDGAWHHIELRNIDWTARTFDIYVDGTLAASKTFPTNFGTSVGRVDIFNISSNVTHWDEVDVSP